MSGSGPFDLEAMAQLVAVAELEDYQEEVSSVMDDTMTYLLEGLTKLEEDQRHVPSKMRAASIQEIYDNLRAILTSLGPEAAERHPACHQVVDNTTRQIDKTLGKLQASGDS